MSTGGEPVDASHCPLCGSGNACAQETQRRTGVPQPPCWCRTVNFAPELLARIPRAQRGLACVCARCAERPPD